MKSWLPGRLLGVFQSVTTGPSGLDYGMQIVHDPEGALVDIVFVHGLTGHRTKTWTMRGSEKPWFETLLPSELPQARIMTFGYDANVVDWRALVSKNRVDNHSQNLLAALSGRRTNSDASERPILFVAHSLGGLVCEDALLWSSITAEEHLKKILNCTRGILFLGTPHSGSGFAVAAEALAKWLGFLKQTNSKILEVLRTDSEVLARIEAGFQNLVRAREKDSKHSISITCFYEELPLRGVGEVVPQNSARLLAYQAIGIHKNHMEMTKFENKEDDGFCNVLGELRRWANELGAIPDPIDADDQTKTVHQAIDGGNREKHICSSNHSVITHNGANGGQARVVYGGNMTNVAT